MFYVWVHCRVSMANETSANALIRMHVARGITEPEAELLDYQHLPAAILLNADKATLIRRS